MTITFSVTEQKFLRFLFWNLIKGNFHCSALCMHFQSLKNKEPNSEIRYMKGKIKHILHCGVSLSPCFLELFSSVHPQFGVESRLEIQQCLFLFHSYIVFPF